MWLPKRVFQVIPSLPQPELTPDLKQNRFLDILSPSALQFSLKLPIKNLPFYMEPEDPGVLGGETIPV